MDGLRLRVDLTHLFPECLGSYAAVEVWLMGASAPVSEEVPVGTRTRSSGTRCHPDNLGFQLHAREDLIAGVDGSDVRDGKR